MSIAGTSRYSELPSYDNASAQQVFSLDENFL